MAGRPRKPTVLALLHGDHKTSSARFKRQRRENEPQNTDPLTLDPPEYMTEAQKKVYVELVKGCHKDVLTMADLQTVEVTATLLAKFREKQGEVNSNIIGRIYSGLDRLGMSPSARSKVQAVKRGKDGEENNPLGEFAA